MTKGDVVDLSRGKSKILWQIELRWNISKVETHAFYWASDVATVNQVASGVWKELDITMPDESEIKANAKEWNVDGKHTKEGEPYKGYALVNHHATSLAISVKAVKPHGHVDQTYTAPGEAARVITCVEAVGVQAIKRLLKSRKIAFTAGEKKEALALRLHEYIDAAKAPPGSDNENSGPPKAEKSVSFDDGQPAAKKPKKLPPLVVD